MRWLIALCLLASSPVFAGSVCHGPASSRATFMAYMLQPPVASAFQTLRQDEAQTAVMRLHVVIPPDIVVTEIGSAIGYTFQGQRRLAFFDLAGCLLAFTSPAMSPTVTMVLGGLGT